MTGASRTPSGGPEARPFPSVVVFDAMGVLYRDGDVVTRLLVPYLRSKGCTAEPDTIRAVYHACTRGEFRTAELWARLGVAGVASDAEYCRLHRPTPGLPGTLRALVASGTALACLTNDTAEWSGLLRRRFGLERYIGQWYVSAEIGVRKPEARAYGVLLDGLGVDPAEVLFVDDRGPNLVPGRAAGMATMLFTSDDTDRHPIPPETVRLNSLPALLTTIARLRRPEPHQRSSAATGR